MDGRQSVPAHLSDLLLADELMDTSVQGITGALQGLYEAGRVSYPRTDSHDLVARHQHSHGEENMAEFVGYEFLRDRWRLPVFPITRPARVMPVTRVTAQADMLLVPAGVAPNTNSPLDHVLFAFGF